MPRGYYTRTKEACENIRKSKLGNKNRLGMKHTEETKKKISDSKKKNPTRYWLGKKRSEKDKKKMSESHKKNPVRYWLNKKRPCVTGENNSNWKGGITKERKRVWHTMEYQRWRRTVFERDAYTCQECGKRGGVLNAHHIKTQKDHPDLVFSVSNGITLCERPCHSSIKGKEKEYETHFITKLNSKF